MIIKYERDEHESDAGLSPKTLKKKKLMRANLKISRPEPEESDDYGLSTGYAKNP